MVDGGGDFREHVVEVGKVALMEEASTGDDFWGSGGRGGVSPVEREGVWGGNDGLEVIITIKFDQPGYFYRRDLLCWIISDVDELSIVEDEVFKETDTLVRETTVWVVACVGGAEVVPVVSGGEG